MKRNFFSALRRAPQGSHPPEQKSGTQPLVALELSRQASWTPTSFTALASQAYQRNPIAYRCVRMIAEIAASVPLTVYRRGRALTDDPAARCLRQGGPGMTAIDVMEAFYGYLLVGGNGYLELGLISGQPSALFALRPDRVNIKTGAGGWPCAYEYDCGGQKRTLPCDPATGRSPIFHMRLFHPTDDCRGFSPLGAAAQAVDIHNAGGQWTKSLLDNSARPSGALIYKSGDHSSFMTGDQFDRLKDQLQSAYAGARNAGQPMLLEGGLDWKPMSLSPTDMDFLEARREAAREIALALGVPPMLLGIPGDNTYSNYREANQAFLRQTIRPLTQKCARGLTAWMQPWFGDDLEITAELSAVESAEPAE